jgi:hypothetical protein
MNEKRLRAGLRPGPSKRPRPPVAAAALSVGFPAATWLVGGILGLLTGIVIVFWWWGLRPRIGVLWALSVVPLAAAPITIIVEGLPHARVVGPGFGAEHLLAHRVVTVSLALAAFAGLVELLGLHTLRRPGSSLER